MIEIVDSTGEARYLMDAPEGPPRLKWAVYGDVPETPMVPRANWQPADLSALCPPIKDQDGEGACNAFATVNVLEALRALAGLPPVRLSPGWLYGNINGQCDQGSLLEDALRWAMDSGTCTAATVPELAWRRSDWPASAAAEARRFRLLEAYWCPTFEHVASAIQSGFFVDMGVLWYENYTPDASGWLPPPRGRAGGHAIMGARLVQDGSRWGAGFPNSWGPRWGLGGWGVLPEGAFGRDVGGMWAGRAVVTEDLDTPSPKEE